MINFDMIGRDEAPSDQTNGLIDIPTDPTNRLNLSAQPVVLITIAPCEKRTSTFG